MNYKIIAIEVLLIIICTVIAYLLSNDKPTAALTSLSTALAALSVLVSASSAEDSHKQTEKILKLTETEQRKKDINERLKYFYLPIKDILEPNCALLKENHTRYNNPTEIYIDNFAGMFDKKMESLKNEYIEEYRNPNSIEIIKIKHSSAEESNNLLIHLITIKEIKKIKQYRHFANSYTSKLFETYILGLSRATETEYRSKSIFETENN